MRGRALARAARHWGKMPHHCRGAPAQPMAQPAFRPILLSLTRPCLSPPCSCSGDLAGLTDGDLTNQLGCTQLQVRASGRRGGRTGPYRERLLENAAAASGSQQPLPSRVADPVIASHPAPRCRAPRSSGTQDPVAAGAAGRANAGRHGQHRLGCSSRLRVCRRISADRSAAGAGGRSAPQSRWQRRAGPCHLLPAC